MGEELNRVRGDMGDATRSIEGYDLHPGSTEGFGEEWDVAAVSQT